MGSGYGKVKMEIHALCVLFANGKNMFRHVTEFPIFGNTVLLAERGWIKMSDLISRQAVIDLIMETDPFWCEGMTRTIFDGINRLPSVDALPVKRGKWIDETFEPWGLVHHPFKCNLCGEHAEFASPYCPNCGARMDKDGKTD